MAKKTCYPKSVDPKAFPKKRCIRPVKRETPTSGAKAFKLWEFVAAQALLQRDPTFPQLVDLQIFTLFINLPFLPSFIWQFT
jgi:hypothetical protein